MSDVRMQASKTSSLSKKPTVPPKVLPRPKSAPRCPDPSERAVNTAKYSEQSSPMRFGDAVGYFNPSPANVFLVSEGSYSPKGSAGVKKGERHNVCGACAGVIFA